MDLSLERDSSALGSLFQQIINDMKNSSPLWEDFVSKTSKLHACLRAAIQAIAAYLDAFQKIADAATNSRGASKEIGTALTRVCLRHRAVETRLKTFTTAIMDCLVQPLQDKLEDWKRSVATIDKEHAKEYKRCRTELKKRSSDTLRLQKKARKGQSDTIQSLMDSHMQDVTLRRAELEEVEKKSLRSAMIEERLRYCTFVHMLQPVVKEECEVMSELGHLQEAMQSIAIVTKDPNLLPQASEELIHDAKATMTLYPESPGGGSGSQGNCSNSLGSRKSSVCSISSMNSSGSSNSPGHHHYPRSLSQLISPAIRLKPGESSDSGFCSSPALTTQASTAASQSHAISTWPPHSQDAAALPPTADRPHTISSAYEKGHQRPPLTVYTFQNPETILEGTTNSGSNSGQNTPSTQKSPAGALSRPPLPVRCSSLERPLSANNNRNGGNLMQRQCPSPIPAHITKELSAHHAQQQQYQQQQQQQQQLLQQQQQQLQSPPTYVNMSELANMAALKITNQQKQQQPPLQQQPSIDSISSQHSNESTTSNLQQQQQQMTQNHATTQQHANTTRSHSISSTNSSNTPSLHSHPSIESTVATSLIGQTPTPSSGSSTPQNHYSPLLTNSPSSTAAGTPSGASITSGMTSGFLYNVNSPTPPQSGTPSSVASDALKIIETDGHNTQNSNTPTNDTSNTVTPSASADCSNMTDNTKSVTDTDSPTIVENDERSRASVLQKASMFEKQAAAVANNSATPPVARTPVDTGIYGTRRSDEYRATANTQNQSSQQQIYEQQDVDKSFEDSIQELNNLIGELDSFQREIDESKQRNTSNSNSNSNSDPFTNSGNVSELVADTTIISDMTTTTTTTLICQQQQQQQHQQQPQKYCPSNQTNSSGCGTDISDTTSDEMVADTRSLTSLNYHNNDNNKQNCNYNSDSELSRCYVSETSSLTGGYENPTFAHFATTAAVAGLSTATVDNDSRSLLADDCISHTTETLSMHRHAYVDNGSDSGSAVVVIYDHQIPITPDIDYVKQNSEIVVLRTKDPQQLQLHEVRELQQLPANLSGLTESPTTPTSPHTATVAPAKQRLSSFRASSEQQLQLLGIGNNNNGSSSNSRYHLEKGMHEVKNHLKQKNAEAANISATITAITAITATPSDTIIRRKLPPKPSLSIYNGNTMHTDINYSNNINKMLPTTEQQQQQQNKTQIPPQLPPKQQPIKADFKADLDAKIRKQKQKILMQAKQQVQQEQQQQTVQQQQQQEQAQQLSSQSSIPSNTIHNNPNNCNTKSSHNKSTLFLTSTNKNASATTNASSSALSSTVVNANIATYSNSSNHTHTHLNDSLVHYQQQQQQQQLKMLQQQNAAHVPMHTMPEHANSQMKLQEHVVHAHNPNHTKHTKSLPLPLPLSSISTSTSTSSSSTPLPYSVSMSVTTSSMPVTSASLVSSYMCATNAATMVSAANATAVPSKPSITPRPASLSGGGVTRIARRSSVNTAKPPPPVRRSSSVTPSPNTAAGPTILQAQTHSTTATTTTNLIYQQQNSMNNSTESLPPPPAYLLDARQTQSTPASPPTIMPNSALKVAETVKALAAIRHEPASPNTLRRMQQSPLLQQPQQPQQQQTQLPTPTTTLQSFRTSSPGIYAQPKIVSNMTSFRSASPGANGHHLHQPQAQHTHQTPTQAQPKTNPNLIAQLNARLNNKQQQQQQLQQQQQQNAADAIYGSTPNSPNHHYNHQANESIYMRSYNQQQQTPTHQQQHQQQQQQIYDDYTSTNIDKAGSIRSKTKAEFLENLNAKLAKQGMSGRAFAVRNLINSKALMYQNPQKLSRPSAQYRPDSSDEPC